MKNKDKQTIINKKEKNNIIEQEDKQVLEDNMIPKKKTLKQVIQFCLVGVSNTLVSYVVYMVCYHLLHTNVHAANIIAFIISVLNAYYWQEKYVFKAEDGKEKRVWWKVLLKTYTAYMFTGLVLTEVFIVLWLKVVHLQNYMTFLVNLASKVHITMSNYEMAVSIIPFINILINTPINFLINKFWAYRQK